MYGPASCGSTGGPWCNYVWKNNKYTAPLSTPSSVDISGYINKLISF